MRRTVGMGPFSHYSQAVDPLIRGLKTLSGQDLITAELVLSFQRSDCCSESTGDCVQILTCRSRIEAGL